MTLDFLTFAEIGFDWQNMIDNRGPMMALIGMTIVFLALAFISLFIALLPRLIGTEDEPQTAASAAAIKPSAATAEDDTALAAAIGFALYTQRQRES